MKVLVLEDNLDRQQLFLRRYPNAVVVATAPVCIERLEKDWDVIYLDHDLGGNRLPGSDREDCGRIVVLYILEHHPAHLKRATFIIHSANTHRARGMAEDLRRAGYHAECRSFINLLPELQKPPE